MHRAFFTFRFATFVTGSMMEGCPGHLVHLVNSATKCYPSSAAISSSSNSNFPSSVYITPPVAAVSFVTSRCHRLVAGLVPGTAGLIPGLVAVSSPPDSVVILRFSSCSHHLFNVFLNVNYRKISQCSPNKDGGRRLHTDLLPHTLPHRSPPSRSSPAVVAVLSPVSFPGPPVSSPVSSPPDSVATRRFSSRPHHLFNVFLKVRHRKISQCSPNKDGGCRFEYTA